jgi:hypothetical protein
MISPENISFNPEVARINENAVENFANQAIASWQTSINLDALTSTDGKINNQEKQRLVEELKKCCNKALDNIRRAFEGTPEDSYGHSHATALANLLLEKLTTKHIPDNIAPRLDDEVKEDVRTVLSQIGGALEKKETVQ